MRLLIDIAIFIVAVFFFAMALGFVSARAECFTTSPAVFKAHPGADTHATWNMIDHRKCWYAKGQTPGWEKPSTEREVMQTGPAREATTAGRRVHDSRPRPAKLAGAVPTPKERPETTALAPTRVRTVPVPAFTYGTLTDTDRAIAIETTGAAPAQAVALAWPEVQQEPATVRPAVLYETTVVHRESRTMSGLELLVVFLLALGIPGALTGIPFLPDAWRWWRARSMGAR